jgi:hypothetical protein
LPRSARQGERRSLRGSPRPDVHGPRWDCGNGQAPRLCHIDVHRGQAGAAATHLLRKPQGAAVRATAATAACGFATRQSVRRLDEPHHRLLIVILDICAGVMPSRQIRVFLRGEQFYASRGAWRSARGRCRTTGGMPIARIRQTTPVAITSFAVREMAVRISVTHRFASALHCRPCFCPHYIRPVPRKAKGAVRRCARYDLRHI